MLKNDLSIIAKLFFFQNLIAMHLSTESSYCLGIKARRSFYVAYSLGNRFSLVLHQLFLMKIDKTA